MIISAYNSKKLQALSFFAIMMVLYIHAVFNEAKDMPLLAYVQGACAFSGLSFVANPLFYTISGFLFFSGVTKVAECYPKIKKRFKTLLIPYIIWNIIFVLWYVVLSLLPGVSKFVNSDMIGDIVNDGPFRGLYVLFVAPAAFQLWYVRDLIIYVLLSPVIYKFINRFRVVGLIVLFLAGTLGIIYLPSEIKIWGIFFFTLGGYIALHSSLDEIEQKITPTIAYVCLVLYLLNAIIRPLGFIPLAATDMLVEFCGIIAVWKLYDVAYSNGNTKIISILANGGGYSFFIYLFHEPVFNIVKKLGVKVCGLNEVYLTMFYLICPFIMASVSILVAKSLQRVTPKVYSVLVGGR